MRNITLSAEDELIARARLVAMQRHTTLNQAFRDWLAKFTASASDLSQFDELMSRLTPMKAGRHFTREEMSERT
jgi:predicted transcriptional regulator